MKKKDQLTDYIKTELKKGFSIEEIKKALINAGHNIKEIQNIIEPFEKKMIDKSIQHDKYINPKLETRLIHFIEISLKNGKSLKEIESNLLKAGNDINKIKLHIDHTLKHHTGDNKEIKTNKFIYTFTIFIVFLILTAGVLSYIFNPELYNLDNYHKINIDNENKGIVDNNNVEIKDNQNNIDTNQNQNKSNSQIIQNDIELTCSYKKILNCNSEEKCLSVKGQWCGNYCSIECINCSEKTLNYCITETDCTLNNGIWCDSYCAKECFTCSKDFLVMCKTKEECQENSGNWCDNSYCLEECPVCSSEILIFCKTRSECEKMKGTWCGTFCSDSC